MTGRRKLHQTKSSIYYHFYLEFAQFWNALCSIILIVSQIIKMYNFPYKKTQGNFSVAAPFLWCVINVVKLMILKRGNQNENSFLLLGGFLLCAVSIMLEVYFVAWQKYLWKWELPFHIISIVIDGTALGLGLMTVLIFITH